MPIITGPTIAAGQSLSDAIDITAPNVVLRLIIFPPQWTSMPPLTFQASVDGVTFYDLYDVAGKLVTMQVMAGGCCALPADQCRGAWFKFRSGMPNGLVAQHQQRIFTCKLD